jgi:hypothetical protein
MNRILLLIIVVLSISWSSMATAFNSAWAQHVEQRVTRELTAIVHGYDPDAIVLVRVGLASLKELDLPGTPFNIDTATLSGTDGNLTLGSIKVQIIGKKDKISPEAKLLIQAIATVDSVVPMVTYMPTPKGFVNPKDRVTDAKDPTANEPAPAPTADNNSMGAQVRDVIKSSAGSLGSDIRQMLMIGALTVGLALIALIVVVFSLVRQATKIAQSMSNKDGASSSVAAEPVQAPRRQRDHEERSVAEQRPTASGDSSNVIRDLPIEAVIELLGDCYWGPHDGYAAFLWNRLTIEHRKKVIESSNMLAAYVASLGNTTEIDLGAHSEAVYMKGITLSHLNNEVLAEMTRKQPMLLSILPRLRVESLPFSIVEWIELNKATADSSEKLPNFAGIAPSQKRDIRVRHKYTRISVAEEETILSLRGVSVELVESVRSLAWITSIEGDPLKNLLKDFSAQDLAEALAAPQAAIDHALAHLPEKKRALTIGYMRSSAADRQSESYDALFKSIVDHLRGAGAEGQEISEDTASTTEDGAESADANGGSNGNAA